MKVNNKTIKYLVGIITGDSGKTEYKSGPQLVEFFNNIGFSDIYGIGFPSRKNYCYEKLSILNKQNKIELAIENYYNPINFIGKRDLFKELIEELNEYLYFDNLILRVFKKSVKLEELSIYNNKNVFDSINYDIVFKGGVLKIAINQEIYNHIKSLLEKGEYFNAVEEAYKYVRNKLEELTGFERATDAFGKNSILGKKISEEKKQTLRDFYEGIKFLHFAIQYFRNEKAHTPRKELDKNLAFHYISLASLALELLNKMIKI